ncbi:Dabb family protein [Clostridium sp.]|uniref:Dabb family protein n=1 Tax=Clostridium sp. TaxID=1506 RepID=UPI003F30CDAB
MIKHIVMWKLKSDLESKESVALEIKEKIEGLKDLVKEIEKIEVGINIENSKDSYDVVLYSEFKDKEGLDIYQNHSEHLKVAKFISSVRESRKVVDYII